MYKTYDYKCETCGSYQTYLTEDSERDMQQCVCGMPMQRIFATPNIRTSKLSASFVDGQRGRSKEFVQLRDQHKLEDRMFDAETHEERKAAESEFDAKIKESSK